MRLYGIENALDYFADAVILTFDLIHEVSMMLVENEHVYGAYISDNFGFHQKVTPFFSEVLEWTEAFADKDLLQVYEIVKGDLRKEYHITSITELFF